MKTLVQLITVLVVALIPIQVVRANSEDTLSQTLREAGDTSGLAYYERIKPQIQPAMAAQLLSKKQQPAPASTFELTIPGIGSVVRLKNEFAVLMAQGMFLGVYQNTPQGPKDVGAPFTGNIAFKTAAEQDAFMRQWYTNIAKCALTNSAIDMTQPLNLFSYTATYHFSIDWVTYMYISKQFSLIKSSDGSYHLPDVSGYEMQLNNDMTFGIPRAKYVEVSARFNPITSGRSDLAFYVNSKGFGDGPVEIGIDPGHEYLKVRTSYLTSGTNGPTLLEIKINVPPKDRYVWGPMGEQLPFMANMLVSGQQISFDLTAKRGRAFRVESTTSVGEPWVQAGSVVVPSDSSTVNFKGNTCGPTGMFRVVPEYQP